MRKFFKPIWFGLWSILAISQSAHSQQAAVPDDGYEEMKLFTRVLETIREKYVDSDKVTYEKLINSALEGMLADLDPHCQFMQPTVFKQLQQNTDSTYQGIGITVSSKNDQLSVVTVREDGPAARAGLLAGDHILKVNDVLTEDVGLAEAVNMLRGRPGETLKLTVRRPATGELLEMNMVREVIRETSVKDIMMLPSSYAGPHKIGYARILQFSEPSAKELADGLDKLEQEGMEAFILDLRNNPGGLLRSAIDICGEFVKAGTAVLTTEGKPGSGEIRTYRTSAEQKRRERDYPLVIIVNQFSASASEVVSGALQDLKRCVVVGATSFGKGSVQTILPIEGSNGKAIRLTTAKYYTPNHITIHENGVTPNIPVPLSPGEEIALMKWFDRENLSPEAKKEAEKFVDPQIGRAADALKGVLVYSARNKPAPIAAETGEAKKE